VVVQRTRWSAASPAAACGPRLTMLPPRRQGARWHLVALNDWTASAPPVRAGHASYSKWPGFQHHRLVPARDQARGTPELTYVADHVIDALSQTGTPPDEQTAMRYATRASELDHRRLHVPPSPLRDPSPNQLRACARGESRSANRPCFRRISIERRGLCPRRHGGWCRSPLDILGQDELVLICCVGCRRRRSLRQRSCY
jgi:hypothetical protein